MDCDDVLLLVAVGDDRTLTGAEKIELHEHISDCERCRVIADDHIDSDDGAQRWVARIPQDALDDRDLLVLPTVNPVVFERGDELAHGGMGRITRARDRRLGREVAIKEVLAPYMRARFEREAMITAKLQHPAIVPVYEAGTWPDGSAFYTMRLVPGGTLSDAIGKTRALEDRLALLPHVVAVTEALAYAHARRIVHRDLKPGNVLVGEFGETVVIDWGLAKELDRGTPGPDPGDPGTVSAELTRAGTVIGTPCFLAPEQAAGADSDERADVYALGAILYNLLAGQPPYWDSTEHSADRLVAAAIQAPPTPIAERAPGVPADLRAIVERAMARDRETRYPTAREMAEELRRFEAGQLLRSREYTTRELVARWIRRHRAAVAVAAAAITLLAIGGVIAERQILARQAETEHALAESELEQGRQLLLGGNPAQAAPYLAAAYGALPGDPAARRLVAAALRDVPRRIAGFPAGATAFRRDGGELAIGRADGSVAVIDPATGAALRTLPPLGGAINQLAYAPDGRRIAIAAATGAYLRDAVTGQAVTLGDTASFDLCFLPGERIAIGTAAALRVVGFDGKLAMSDDGVTEPRALALAADGAHLAGVVGGGAVAWNLADLSRAIDIPLTGALWYAALYDRGGLITGGRDGVHRWDPDRRVSTLVSGMVIAVSWVDDRTLLADQAVIDVVTGAVHDLAHHSVQAAARIDRTHVITGGYDRALRIWDLERPAGPTAVLDAGAATSEVIVDPTGRRAVTAGRGDAELELWDVGHTPAPVQRVELGRKAPTGASEVGQPSDAPVTTVEMDATDKIDAIVADHRDRLAVHLRRGVTRLMTAGLAAIATVDGWPIGFRPGSQELITDDAGRLEVYASGDGRHLRTLDAAGTLWHLAFAPSGALAATSSDDRVELRDAAWAITAAFPVPSGISTLAVDDDGRIATGHEDGMLRIWDGHSGMLLAALRAHTEHINEIEIRGDRMVTAGWDLTMRRWAFPSGESQDIFKSFDRVVDDIASTPGGELFATADGTAEVSLWDGARGRLLAQLPTSDRLAAVAFVDDTHLAVGGDGGRLELFDLTVPDHPPGEVQRLAGASRWQLVRGRIVERTPAPAPR